jgi:outer membrane protein, heavy metal efflux system
MTVRALLLIAAGCTVMAGCASLPDKSVAALSARLERDVGIAPAVVHDPATQARVEALLGEPLSPQAAVEIALINHPRVIAAFEALGIAQADYRQAVSPGSVSVHHMVLRPDHPGPVALKWGLGLDLARLLSLPASRRVAAGQRAAQEAEATAEVLAVAMGARMAWIGLASARQTADLMAQANDSAQAAAAAAEALYSAGNIAKVERDREALFAAEAGIAHAQAQAALVPAREGLLVALGLRGEQQAMRVELERLSAPPDSPITVGDIEARVIASSTDFAIATGTLQAARAGQDIGWFASLFSDLGLDVERERDDGDWKQGVGLSWAAPLFDLGGGERLRRGATARRAQAMAQALELELRAQARIALAQAEAARQIAITRRDIMLPLSAEVFDGAVRDFNAMEIGILELLMERRARLDAGRAAIAAMADYWRAQATLDLLLAGAPTSQPAMIASAPDAAARDAKPGH